jgi:hypothetical protein
MALAAVAACTAGHVAPGPPPTVPGLETTTSTIDFSSITLAAVAGSTTITVGIGPGQATLNGSVTGPGGPVPGATVHVERIVDGSVASTDVTTQPDGTWTLPNVLGGLYRVRAWRAPDLAEVDAQLAFLGMTDTHTFNLQVGSYGGLEVNAAIAPSPPIIGRPANLVVRLSVSTVDPTGIVRAAPQSGDSVELFGQGHWAVDGPATQVTGPSGTVGWQAVCQDLGPQPLAVTINNGDVFPLNLPPCSPVPTTTTAPPTTERSTTTSEGETTTTSKRERSL